MNRIRLLPIVLFAASSLLCLKLVGLVTGLGSFAVGPNVAIAEDSKPPPMPDFLGPPLDLASEAEALRKQQQAAAAAAAAEGGGESEVAANGPAAPAEGDQAAADGAAEGMQPDAMAPTADATLAQEAPPAEAAPAEAPPAAEAAAGEGAASAEQLPQGVSTTRPAEYTPPPSSSQQEFVDSLTQRREALDRRAADLDLKSKLLDAAEAKLQARIDELKGLESQLGVDPTSANTDPAASPDMEETGATPPPDGELKKLVTMYEAMKPKAAARVFNDLNINVLLAVTRAMNPRKMSAIMAVMEPGKAAVLTTALAGNQQPRQIILRREGEGQPEPDPNPADLPKIMPANP